MSRARILRGRRTAKLAADYFRNNGWPYAEAREGTAPGIDITGMPGLAPEVKATSDGPLLGALRQARANSRGALPFVIWRPNGHGPERIDQWVVAFDLATATRLLRDAGYGDPNQATGGAA